MIGGDKSRHGARPHAPPTSLTLRSRCSTGGSWVCRCWTALQVWYMTWQTWSAGSGRPDSRSTSTILPPEGRGTRSRVSSTEHKRHPYQTTQLDPPVKPTFELNI